MSGEVRVVLGAEDRRLLLRLIEAVEKLGGGRDGDVGTYAKAIPIRPTVEVETTEGRRFRVDL